MQQIYFPALIVGSVVLLGALFNVSAISVEKYLTLTASQKIELDKLKERVQPFLKDNYMKQDAFLIQWIRARKFDVNSAEIMFHENLRWRQQNKIDNIRNEDWSDMSLDFHATIDTYDRTERPVCVIDVGKWDIRRTVIQGKGRRFIRYLMYLAESITRQIYERQEKGMNVTQMVVLGNADGFNLIQQGCPLCLPIWIQFIQLFENHYPESIDEIILIEAPPAIQVVLEAMRPFFSRTTRNAIKIFGPNKAKWMPYLDTKISKDERRPQYGGTKPPIKF